ncbi:uncharacterized protein BDV17DRAFT_290403 [Aspergillus undulatus]|uniref:uncharacterized protein n=1 Tax=Aspergillus undulatus TaxID=1810928 RepID=UPI003CCCFF86
MHTHAMPDLPYETAWLAEVVMEVASKIPYDHQSQDELLKIVLDKVDASRLEITESWVGFDKNASNVLDHYWDSPGKETGFKDRHYINVRAFLARLISSTADGSNSSLIWPIVTLRDQLETLRKPEVLSTMIAGVSVSLLLAGPWLYRRVALYPRPSLDADDQRSFRASELYRGALVSKECWGHWRDTLKAKVKGDELNDEARALALDAVFLMGALERHCKW